MWKQQNINLIYPYTKAATSDYFNLNPASLFVYYFNPMTDETPRGHQRTSAQGGPSGQKLPWPATRVVSATDYIRRVPLPKEYSKLPDIPDMLDSEYNNVTKDICGQEFNKCWNCI